MIYVLSDPHGCFDKYCQMLQTIDFRPQDTLYVLGDVVDRGPDGIRILRDMMNRPNVYPILGNHEFMMAVCLRFLMREITEESLSALGEAEMGALNDWLINGGSPTMKAFRALSSEERSEVLEYLGEFTLYEEVRAGGHDYLLVHAGLGNFSPEKPLEEYSPADFIEGRPDYARRYWPDRFVVSGHTPTRLIPENPSPDRIYRANNHIAIDCGCTFGGALGAICLDTGEEYYV